MEVWFDYKKNENVKSMIGNKIKEILELEMTFKLYFKENSKSIEDKSTLKNAEKYNDRFQNVFETNYVQSLKNTSIQISLSMKL